MDCDLPPGSVVLQHHRGKLGWFVDLHPVAIRRVVVRLCQRRCVRLDSAVLEELHRPSDEPVGRETVGWSEITRLTFQLAVVQLGRDHQIRSDWQLPGGNRLGIGVDLVLRPNQCVVDRRDPCRDELITGHPEAASPVGPCDVRHHARHQLHRRIFEQHAVRLAIGIPENLTSGSVFRVAIDSGEAKCCTVNDHAMIGDVPDGGRVIRNGDVEVVAGRVAVLRQHGLVVAPANDPFPGIGSRGTLTEEALHISNRVASASSAVDLGERQSGGLEVDVALDEPGQQCRASEVDLPRSATCRPYVVERPDHDDTAISHENRFSSRIPRIERSHERICEQDITSHESPPHDRPRHLNARDCRTDRRGPVGW